MSGRRGGEVVKRFSLCSGCSSRTKVDGDRRSEEAAEIEGGRAMREMERSFSIDCWKRMVEAMRNVWFAVATHLRFRRRRGVGLLKLDKDVRSCGYEDVHIMWEMLRNSESLSATNHHHHQPDVPTERQRRRPIWKLIAWARRAPLFCHS